MSKKSKKLSATLAFLSLFVLASCDTEEVKLPTDYKEPIFSVTQDKDGNTLAEDKKRDYYDGVTTSDAVYERTVKDILLKLSEKAHDGNKPVYNVVDDTSLKYTSVADYSGTFPTASGDSNLESRAKDNMVSAASGSSYLKDNLFYENKYAKYLNENYYYLDIDSSKVSSTGKFLTPDLTYSDIYSSTAEDAYKKYREHELYEDMKVNYLTSEYIYNKSYASIGNTNARKVQIVSIVDRSDEAGDAKLLLDAYVKDYILGTGTHKELLGKDPEFKVLSRLWKGITKKDATSLGLNSSRYGDVVLSNAEESWLEEYNLRTDSTSRTLLGKVTSDVEKINRGLDNWKLINSDLESTYTGSYAHSLEEGIESAIDDIAKRNLVTKGLYLKGTGISSLPQGLSDRLFSPRVSTSKTMVDKMKTNKGTSEDLTVYEPDGYRYLTVADTVSSDAISNILYYDSSSKTYYITRVLDVVDTSALSKSNSDSIYTSDAAKEQIAREVAYTMSTTGSYKSEASVYWLSRVDFSYSDADFLEYMKTNYKDVFKTDNSYADEPKFTLD